MDANGPIYTLEKTQDETYRSFAGEGPDLTEQVSRAENLLSSDAITTFLRVWRNTGDHLFLDAGRVLLDIIATQLYDPDAGSAAEAIRKYRQIVGDHRYDDRV
jgi:hypothetical protein